MNSQTVSILLVDDEPANLLALEAILESMEQRLVRATSGREALRCVLEEDFAVILLDVRMPDMSGIEAAALIRSRARSQGTPIIFLTGVETSREMMFEGYSAGAVDYLMKPFVSGVLRAKVEVFVELALARQRLQIEVVERHKASTELRKLNMLLEQRNSDLANANAELDAFCAAISHDLRTPLGHIQGFTQLLERSAAGRLNTTELNYLRTVRDATCRMNEMIGDFLGFARLGVSDLHKEPVDMNVLVQAAVDDLVAARNGGHQIEWDIDRLPSVQGDSQLLRQVWVNLLSNAQKYSKQREPARISVGAEKRDDEVVFRVTDNGVGFDMEKAGRLFDAFQRLHSASHFEGVGIGLASVKRIVQRHDGRVWADSQPDAGASFYFSLPAALGPH